MSFVRLASLLTVLAAPLAAGPGPTAAPKDLGGTRVFVLGVDGMDPVVLQRLMDEGRMPSFAELAEEGSFKSLGTSNPPQSPVAWSNFVTGMNPGGHGIYDFVVRDPDDYTPLSSATPPPCQEEEHHEYVDVFGYIVPTSPEEVENNRSGTPFWDHVHETGADVEVYRIPGNYPPTESEAMTLTGMGTVDMKGTPGDYTWYTDEPLFDTDHLKADVQVVSIEDIDGDGVRDTIYTSIKGPPDLFHLEPCTVPSDEDYLRAQVTVHLDADDEVALVRLGGGSAILQPGEWTDWMPVDFEMLPWGMMNMTGMTRFYLKSLDPFRLYASPVNIDPTAPAQPITTPDDDVAVDLAEAMGRYYTQGMPEETNALKDGLFDDDDYVQQVALVHEDEREMLDVALDRFAEREEALTFFYLSDIDLQCHMLWRHGDPKFPDAPPHPGYDPQAARDHADDIEGYYEQVDRVLGHVRSRLDDDVLLLVISDHGFQPQTRKVHLNDWLVQEGYLVFHDGARPRMVSAMRPDPDEEGELDYCVDWSRTKAFALGFNSIYLNLRGRESRGSVDPARADELMDEIIDELMRLEDPETGRRVCLRVDKAKEIYFGDRLGEAPDLVVGYDRGYGVSDASTLGEVVGGPIIEDNPTGFTGNHLMAPEVVPGVLLSNRRIPGDGYALTDVTATLLDLFGVPLDEGMIGRSMFAHP